MWVAKAVRNTRERMVGAGEIGMLVVLAATMALAGNGGDAPGGAYLGVMVGDITQEKMSSLKLGGTQGALIQGVDQDGPACHAGLKANDVIIAVNGKKIQSTMQLSEMMRGMSGGSVASVTVIRDGKPQEVSVTLGNRQQWMPSAAAPMNMPPHPPTSSNNVMVAGPVVAPMPPTPFPADVEVPIFTPSAARRGLVVEAMTPQLGEYFGAPRGQGVLIRNVQKGSLAANSGFKAGDVIVKINGEAIRDLADWRRSMSAASGKTTISVIRDKREQTVEMNIPKSVSRLEPSTIDWDQLAENLQGMSGEMAQLRPELQRDAELAMLNSDEFQKLQRDIDKSVQKQMKHEAKEIEKSMKHLEPEIKKQTRDIQKQMELMRPEIDKQMDAARQQMEQIGPEMAKQMAEMQKSMTLKQEDIDKMRHDIQESMQAFTPQMQEQIQQQMREMQKQMEQWQKDWPKTAPPNEF